MITSYAQKLNPIKKYGITIIEVLATLVAILVLATIVDIAVIVAQTKVQVYGLFLAVLLGAMIVIVTSIIIVANLWMMKIVLDFCFPPLPIHCESKKCLIYNCYHVMLGIDELGTIIYFKCQCGNEYLKHGFDFFAKINENGSLRPYKVNRPGWGWYDDKRANYDDTDYEIPSDVLQELRKENKEDH